MTHAFICDNGPRHVTNDLVHIDQHPVGAVRMKNTRFHMRIDFAARSEEHTSELQSLRRISSALFCLKNKQCVDTLVSLAVRGSSNGRATHNVQATVISTIIPI